MKRFKPFFTALALLIALSALLASCAGGPEAKTTVRAETRARSFERFKSDHAVDDETDMDSAGIYYWGKDFYVVISLTDSGTDRFPEWACDKLLTTLYGYRAVEQSQVSDDEFFELVLKFTLEEIVEGKYENLAKIRIDGRDLDSFLEHYREDF